MYLKSIEVNGFKSFAHKTVFKFEHGITGIVGPNGSGKSNVADAVRWVLGEQSAKQLRGAKMEDVIFSGTQLRRPMGSAYVAITMDNGDKSLPVPFEEVTVARRVYRSGESEYLMNGSTCRRKDIVELFFDTGVGKEGYSIIGQGQIDQILSGKPEDRRELFDEAAGIVKYKKNKIETQKSLDREKENLNRVNDILSELERQIGPLKRQAKKAREYLLYRDRLKDRDSRLFLMENRRMTEELETLDQKIRIAEQDLEETNGKMESAKERYAKEEERLNSLKADIARITQEISDEKVLKQRFEGEIKVLKEQIRTEKIREDHFKANQQRMEQEMEEKDREAKQFRQEADDISAEYQQAGKERVEKESKLAFFQKEIQDLTEELSLLEGRVQDHNDSQMKMAGRLERFQTVKEQLQVRIQNLEEQKAHLEIDWKTAGENCREVMAHLEELDRKEEDLKSRIAAKQKEEMEQEAENAKALSELSKQKEKYHRVRSNYEALRNMAERYEGYGFGIKKIMERKKMTPGVFGTVSDLIKVEKKYEAAIETALGGSIQNVVTDTQDTAKELIGYLRANRFGRVTFLPLNAVKGKPFQRPEAQKEKGVIGVASQLVSFDPQYRDLADSLLGQILVVRTIDEGIAIANKYHHSLRIVTMEGDSLNRGGSMSGGAFKSKSNLLGRNRELKELKNLLAKLTEKIKTEEAKQKENALKLKKSREASVQAKQSLQELILERNTQEMALSAAEAKRKDLQDRLTGLESQMKQLGAQKDATTNDASDLLNQKSDLEIASRKDEENILRITERLEKTRETAEEQAKIIGEIHLKTNQLKQRLEFAQSNCDRVGYELEKLRSDLRENQEEHQKIEETSVSLEEKIEKLQEKMKNRQLETEKKESELQKMQEMEKKNMESYKDTMKEREEMLEQSNRMDKELFRLNGTREKCREEQQELMNYMWENYEITYHQLQNRFEEEPGQSLSKIKEEISEIKKEIRALGPVNVHAAEEYQEVSERYEFLTNQREDVVTAQERLNDLLKELEESMLLQFHEKFKDIQKMFQKVFVELFGGGTAKLELTDDDVLESGIRIIAQPPGKKLQNMMQLSGGEKALTAIALLFAIQNLKPSPFCLLDEIEAALDDSNVKRFAEYLWKLSKDTQFIVITHRRGTMMAADVLYGVTMQEKGVSTQVSVNLIENDLDE